MFDTLSDALGKVITTLKGKGTISDADVSKAMREVRIALLEADVALPVVKELVNRIKEKAVGEAVIKSISPVQMVIKIVQDELTELLGSDTAELKVSVPPSVILMVGLQGSGKTTSTAKIAHYLTTREKKKVLMASLDVYRPAAQEQLATLGKQATIDTLPIIAGEKPEAITKRALTTTKREGYDVLLLDTAGRLHIDDALMDELRAVRSIANPIETLLVADSLTGQDAVAIASSFHEQMELTGIVLTRMDGDGRGGAALSMKHVTGCPIKFIGAGEKISQLEPFHPDRVAQRILGMGDVVSLVEKAAEEVETEEAERMAKRMKRGTFDFNDMHKQLGMIKKLGGMGSILSMLPGTGNLQNKMNDAGIDDGFVVKQQAIITSMTKQERQFPKTLNGSRKKRIAAGAGSNVQEVNQLLKQFKQMQSVMKKMGKMGGMKKLMGGGMENMLQQLGNKKM